MKKVLIAGVLTCSGLFTVIGQDKPQTTGSAPVRHENLTLRPNSRDYVIVRKGNNHQRIVQLRPRAFIRNRQALLNRKMAMERRRAIIRQRMIRQQQIRQRMVHQRSMHR